MLLTQHEKQFLNGLLQFMLQNNSAQYYETVSWQTEYAIISSILNIINSAIQDPNGMSVYDRFGYHHYDLWDVTLDRQSVGWLLSTLSVWNDVNGWYGRPTQPGYSPPTAQVEIVRNIINKLNA